MITVPTVHDGGISSSPDDDTSTSVMEFPDTTSASAIMLTVSGPLEPRSSPAVPEPVFPTSGELNQFSVRVSPDTVAPGG
ncbi:hypothetical protein [Escherichia coli]|uniref:hypothetical protein n=1 Tax=Escherichia coli TaxID=562 RepID=UPI00207655B7|nr:hypothetical protein [Escherichia coli]